MHVRPTILVAILAAAAGASVARLTLGAGSPAFAVDSPSDTALRARVAADRRSVEAGRSSVDGPHVAVGAHDASSSVRATARTEARAVVYVAGNVRRPGVYTLSDDARVADALRAAGGPTASADPIAVDLAARIEDGEEIAVPARGAADAASVPAPDDAISTPRKKQHARHRRRGKHAHRKRRATTVDDGSNDAGVGAIRDARSTESVNVNTADAATLATLPGVGSGLAERIVAFRDLNGPFESADELLDVGGVTASKLDRLAPLVTFDVRRGAPP